MIDLNKKRSTKEWQNLLNSVKVSDLDYKEKSRLINEKCTDNSIYDRSVNRARIIRKKIHNKELSESSRYLPFVKRALSNDTIFIF